MLTRDMDARFPFVYDLLIILVQNNIFCVK